MRGWIRHLCLLVAVLWMAPVGLWLVATPDCCAHEDAGAPEPLPCAPGCADCSCATCVPRVTAPAPASLVPLLRPMGAACLDDGAQSPADTPPRGVFHPPRAA